MKDLFLSVMGLLKSSPPQLRRGEPRCKRGWGGVGREIDSFDQHHPGDLLIDASRYRARPSGRHPSSAEEGSFFNLEIRFLGLRHGKQILMEVIHVVFRANRFQ